MGAEQVGKARCGREVASGLYYELVGDPDRFRTPILFIHGGGGSGTNFRATPDGRLGWADLLAARGYRSWVTDWPGAGRSGYRDLTQLDYDDIIDGYLRLLRDVIREPVAVVPHSMGGAVAWRLVERLPDLVAGVIALAAVHPANLDTKAELVSDDGNVVVVKFALTGVPFTIDRRKPYVYEESYVERQGVANSRYFPRHAIPQLRAGHQGMSPKMLMQRVGLIPGMPVIERTESFKNKRIRLMAGDCDPAHPRAVEERTIGCLRAWGADASLVWLPDRGHSGNGHYIMGESNSDAILEIFAEQLHVVAGDGAAKEEGGMRKIWQAAVTGAALAAAAIIATGPARAADASAPEKTHLTFGIIPTMDYIPVQLAIERGYFKAEGLTVTTRVTPPGNTVPALIGGAIDVSGVNWISTIVAYNRNIPIKVIAEADAGDPGYVVILVKNDSSIRDLHGLVGKKLGSPSAPPGTCDVLIADTLHKPDAGTGIKFTSLPVPQMMPTLAQGDIDAICLPEPLLTPVLQKKDARVIYDPYADDHEGLPIVAYVVAASFAEKNPKTVAAVERAIAKAEKLCVDDPAAVRAVLPSFVHITPEQAAHVTLPKYVEHSEPQQIERLAKLLGDVGVLEKPVKVPTVGGR